MNDSRLIAALAAIGFTDTETRIYTEMICKLEISASDMFRITGLNRSRTYAVLSSLVSKGICSERKEGRKRFYRAVRPYDLLEKYNNVCSNRELQLGELLTNLEKIYDKNHTKNTSIDLVEVIHKTDQLHKRYIDLVNQSQSEILNFVRSPFVCSENNLLKRQSDAEINAQKRGVKSRSVFMNEDVHDDWQMEIMEELYSKGVEVYVTEYLPMKMTIVDASKVLLALPVSKNDPNTEFVSLIISNSGFTTSCVQTFINQLLNSSPLSVWKSNN